MCTVVRVERAGGWSEGRKADGRADAGSAGVGVPLGVGVVELVTGARARRENRTGMNFVRGCMACDW
jgi:hypothetical protein